MGYAKAFDYDLFISYAREDDLEGRVSEFVVRLRTALSQRLGERPSLYFDTQDGAAGVGTTDEILAAVRRSALFLAVGSPTYVHRDFTRRELETFSDGTSDPDRLFLIELLPLDTGKDYPAPLNAQYKLAKRFYRRASDLSAVDLPISHTTERYAGLIQDLAVLIRTRLVPLGEGPAGTEQPSPGAAATSPMRAPDLPLTRTAPGTPPKAAAPGKVRTVLIGQTTDDAADYVDQLRRYLGQFPEQVRVLPEAEYPQGGDEFVQAFQHDLDQADLYVHLLGGRAGRTPPDLPEGYTRHQLNAAAAKKVKRILWRPPTIAAGSDAAFETTLADAGLVISGFEELKEQVLKEAREKPAAARPHEARVFIDADQPDIFVAEAIRDEFARSTYKVALPKTTGDPEKKRDYLERMMVDSQAIIIVHGESDVWVKTHLRLYNKVRAKRSADPKLLAVFTVPPAKETRFDDFVAGIRAVDCAEGYSPTPIRSLIAELQA
jgi:hypothetical protein